MKKSQGALIFKESADRTNPSPPQKPKVDAGKEDTGVLCGGGENERIV